MEQNKVGSMIHRATLVGYGSKLQHRNCLVVLFLLTCHTATSWSIAQFPRDCLNVCLVDVLEPVIKCFEAGDAFIAWADVVVCVNVIASAAVSPAAFVVAFRVRLAVELENMLLEFFKIVELRVAPFPLARIDLVMRHDVLRRLSYSGRLPQFRRCLRPSDAVRSEALRFARMYRFPPANRSSLLLDGIAIFVEWAESGIPGWRAGDDRRAGRTFRHAGGLLLPADNSSGSVK